MFQPGKRNCSYSPKRTSGSIFSALGVIARSGALPSALVVWITSPVFIEFAAMARVSPASSNAPTVPPLKIEVTSPLAIDTENSGCRPSSWAVV